MNPWILAALVFGVIGLITEATQRKDDTTAAEKAAATKATSKKKKAKTAPKVVVVETHPQAAPVVKSVGEKPVEVLPAKLAVKVLTDTPKE